MAKKLKSAGDGIVSDSTLQTGLKSVGHALQQSRLSPGGLPESSVFAHTASYGVLRENSIDDLSADLVCLLGSALAIFEDLPESVALRGQAQYFGALYLLRQSYSVANEHVRRIEHALTFEQRAKPDDASIGGAA